MLLFLNRINRGRIKYGKLYVPQKPVCLTLVKSSIDTCVRLGIPIGIRAYLGDGDDVKLKQIATLRACISGDDEEPR